MSMQIQLRETWAEQINETHSQCLAYDDDLKDVILRKINKARECGIYLKAAKDEIGHGGWERWVRENLRFSIDTAKLYMRFADSNREPVTDLTHGIHSLKDAMVACGALAAPSGHARQQLHASSWFSSIVKHVMEIQGAFNKHIESEPVDQWPVQLRAQFKDQIQPLVQIYERL